jgi:hypothetical protein
VNNEGEGIWKEATVECNTLSMHLPEGIEKYHEKPRKIRTLAENLTGYLPIKFRSSTQLARSCLFKYWGIQ